ncbi:MAG: protein kinase [Microgenomates group bacterium]|jgi:serine/threonine protein kinase
MFKHTETEKNNLRPATMICLLDPVAQLKPEGFENYEDNQGNRFIKEKGKFIGTLALEDDNRYNLLSSLPVKGLSKIKSFILKIRDNATGNIVAAKTGPIPTLLKEAELMDQATNPHITQFLGMAVSKNADPCIIMEWLHGGTLKDQIQKPSLNLPLHWLASTIDQTATALSHINMIGYVHGDIKPSNIMFNEEGKVKVVDFSNSFPITEAGSTSPDISCDISNNYAPPEQFTLATKGKGRLHIQSDVFSFATVIFESLTCRKSKLDREAFVEDVELPVPLSAAYGDILPSTKQKLLSHSLRRALAPDYRKRHATIEEFNSEIQEILA